MFHKQDCGNSTKKHLKNKENHQQSDWKTYQKTSKTNKPVVLDKTSVAGSMLQIMVLQCASNIFKHLQIRAGGKQM